jgi:lipoprotein NlpD
MLASGYMSAALFLRCLKDCQLQAGSSMENREIIRKAVRLPAVAVAAVVIAGCAAPSPPPVQPSDTMVNASPSSSIQSPSSAISVSVPQAPVLVTRRYVVRRGDTLTGIASANGCGIDDLRTWNGLGSSGRLRIGQALRIVTKTSTPAASAGVPARSDRQVVGETKRHASGVALIWPARGNLIEAFKPGLNRGIQIAGRNGEPVRAAADGRVMYAGVGLNDYGSLIIVQHNADFLTAYAHNRKLLVKTGDIVRQGQQIAEMGDLDSTRVALSFEVRRDGKPVNPLPYLSATSG